MTWRRFMSGQWLGVGALALLAYLPSLIAAPGRMPSDTKLYLYLDPGRLISDAPYTWDNRQFAGWVPHQTVTYLWPSGPWYWLFEQLRVADWVAHRLWIATLLFVGGLGVRWAARLLGLAVAGALTAAVVYQLSPYILPYLSRTSLMLLPWASLGWLVALTIRSATLTKWRDPAIFALVIFTVGSPNATALAMIAPAPVLWLVHAAWQHSIAWRRAISAALRIGGLSLGVSLWWIAMLVVQSRHGADVLSYSETLEAVSFTSVSTETLRGLGYWLFYIRDPSGFATSASVDYLESGRVIAIGFALLLCCIAGIALTRWSQRRYAAMLVFVGIVLAVGVHPIADPSPLMSGLATSSRSTLSLAIRSSTRALPLSSFGLALGAGALATAVATVVARRRPRLQLLLPGLVMGLAILNLPALFDGGFVDPALERDENPPSAWQEAATALDAGSMEHRVMQLPGTEFGAFRWGYTIDPPLPGLTAKPLITRDLLPLGSPAAMDLLYALDDRAQSNTLDPASIAPVARLFGADTIWVSNDIAFDRFRTPRPEITDATFAAPPSGLATPLAFGTPTPNVPMLEMLDETALVDDTIGQPLPPVELVKVGDPVAMVRAASRVVILAGSGDGIVDASAAGLLKGDEAILYAADLRSDDHLDDADLVIITDSNRDRAHHWRGTQDVVGFTETGGPLADVLRTDTADQRLPVFADQSVAHETTAAIEGLDVRATGYGEPFAYRPEDRPAMAVDGDPSTAWLVGDRFDPIGHSIEVSGDVSQLSLLQSQRAGASRMISSVQVAFDDAAPQVLELDERSLLGRGQPIEVPANSTFVRITIVGVAPLSHGADPGPSAVGFAELGLGAHLEVVNLPSDVSDAAADTPLAVVLTRLRTDPLNRWRSDPEPRLVRDITVGTDRSFVTTLTLHRNDRATDDVLNKLAGVATATSNRRLVGDPHSTAARAIDGDTSTAWTSPFFNVVGSRLQIPLDPLVETSSAVITQPLDQQHSVITSVSVAFGDQSTVVAVPPPDESGRSEIAFPAAAATSLSLTIDNIEPRTTVDRRYAETTVLPAAMSEIEVPSMAAAIPLLAPPACRTDLAEFDGQPIGVEIGPDTLTQLLAGTTVTVQLCDSVPLNVAAGRHRLITRAGTTTGIDVNRVVLRDVAVDAATPVAVADPLPTVTVQRTRTARTATVTNCPTGCWLILGEGFNDGWKAELDTVDLSSGDLGPPRQISGGFNGWWLPGSPSPVTVTMTWAPQGTMWIGIILALLAVLVCAFLIWRDWERTDMAVVSAPVLDWPPHPVGRQQSVAAAAALVVLAFLTISPEYGLIAAMVGVVVVIAQRPLVAGAAALVLMSGLAALIVRRQLRYRLVANPSWPAAFDDLHRLGLLVVVLLLASAIADDCRDDRNEQLS
ncbi:MAG: alpha-(1-_3)-arabinofuranosyltransferase family protein [Ilumatobacteraceae bacterium]